MDDLSYVEEEFDVFNVNSPVNQEKLVCIFTKFRSRIRKVYPSYGEVFSLFWVDSSIREQTGGPLSARRLRLML